MAGWVRLAPQLDKKIEFMRLARMTGLSHDAVLLRLYRLADWFDQHGHYGKMGGVVTREIIDFHLETTGFAKALESVGWLRVHEPCYTLFGFTDASARRKSLGAKVRAQVLAAGKCAACGSTEDLQVDHIVPIVRGGSCELDNLQALCAPCNRAKGRKLEGEWRSA